MSRARTAPRRGGAPWRAGAARAAAAATALACAALAVAAPAAEAQQDPPDVRLQVTALDAMLGDGAVIDAEPPELPRLPGGVPAPDGSGGPAETSPDGELQLRGLVESRSEEPVSDLELVIELYPAVEGRSELLDALGDDGPAGGPIWLGDLSVHDGGEVAPGELAGVRADLDVDELGLDGQGVHPLRLALMRGATVLDEATTAVVHLDEPPQQPLLTTLLWPIEDLPWRVPGGDYRRDAQEAIAPGGRLDVLLGALERHPQLPVVPAPSARLLEDLRDQAGGFVTRAPQRTGPSEAELHPADGPDAALADRTLQRVRDLVTAQEHPPVAGPYADAALARLLLSDPPQRELAGELATTERARLLGLLDRAVDPVTTHLEGPLTPGALDLVSGDHVLLAPETVTSPREPGVRTVRSASGRVLQATVGDPDVRELLSSPQLAHGPLLAAQRVVALTAAIHLEDPQTAARPLSIHPPPRWQPDPGMLERLLLMLGRASWLQPTGAAELATDARRGGEPVTLADPDVADDDGLIADLAEAREALDRWRAAYPDEAEQAPHRPFDQLEDELLRATARRQSVPGAARDLVEDVQTAVDRGFGTVEVASESSITLTSETGSLPVTVQRTRGGPIGLRVEVASQGRLVWPEGRQSDTLAMRQDDTATVTFETRALSTGAFPVTVRVTDPSGERELTSTTLTVRSTAVSGVALTATGALVAVLLLVGALRRPGRRRHLGVVSGRGTADED